MRIAQIAPLQESVPPKTYGGTERIVHYLTEELVRQGHEVTLFASGDSQTSARLIPAGELSLRLGARGDDALARHVLLVERALALRDRFEVMHWHIDYLPFPALRRTGSPSMATTLHGRLDLPALADLYHEYDEMPLVSISHAQRRPLPWACWRSNVYHGIPESLYRPGPGGDYLAYVGRISPEKKVDSAIRIARRAGVPLKIAAKVDAADKAYFKDVVKPLLNGPGVEFIGEIGEDRKCVFLGGAMALLFPIDWPEPFGLAMIESMACGTPVLARRRGAVPEVVDAGITGLVFETDEEAARLVESVARLDRGRCRRHFSARFGADRMARDYVEVYRRLMEEDRLRPGQVRAAEPHFG